MPDGYIIYYDMTVGDSQMFRNNLRKVLGNEWIVNLRSTFTIQSGNNPRRKAILTVIYMLTVIVLGTIVVNFGSTIAVVHAGSVEGFGVGIYWDRACTNRTVFLDWGYIAAGSSTSLTVYVKNEGNSAVSLWLSTSTWTPVTSSSHISLSWNYSRQILNTGQIIPLTLTLTVEPALTGVTNFIFSTTISTANER
jgi:ABC-type multidrug transport system fused ATPase/permease subunit